MPALLGNRIFLYMPKEEEKSKLIVDENTKEALQKEMLKKMSKMTVHSVGDLVTTVKPGNVVLVDPYALQKAPMISIADDEIVLLVSPFDVILVW